VPKKASCQAPARCTSATRSRRATLDGALQVHLRRTDKFERSQGEACDVAGRARQFADVEKPDRAKVADEDLRVRIIRGRSAIRDAQMVLVACGVNLEVETGGAPWERRSRSQRHSEGVVCVDPELWNEPSGALDVFFCIRSKEAANAGIGSGDDTDLAHAQNRRQVEQEKATRLHRGHETGGVGDHPLDLIDRCGCVALAKGEVEVRSRRGSLCSAWSVPTFIAQDRVVVRRLLLGNRTPHAGGTTRRWHCR